MKRPLSVTPKTDTLAAAFHSSNGLHSHLTYLAGKRLIRLARTLERDNAALRSAARAVLAFCDVDDSEPETAWQHTVAELRRTTDLLEPKGEP